MAINMTFVDFVTPIPADWLNNVNTVVNSGFFIPANSITNAMLQANSVGTSNIQTGAVSTKLNTESVNQLATGHFFSDSGGRIQRFNDRLFLGFATQNDGKQTPVTTDWTGTAFSVAGVSAWGYLEANGTMNVSAINGQLAGVFVTRTSDAPNPGGSSIGVSSLALNDRTVGGGADSWCYYGTSLRTGSGQSTLGMELDMSNLANAVPIYPNQLFNTGLTANLWIAAGGELAGQIGGSYTFANVSAAMVIFANNGGGYSNVAYDKGIVFGSNALNSNNTAIAFYTGHNIQWFNGSNAVIGSINSTASTTAQGQSLQFTSSGTQILDLSGHVQFSVGNSVTAATNFVSVLASTTGLPPTLSTAGGDTNIDMYLVPKGTGLVSFGTFTATTFAQTGYISIKDSGGNVRRLMVG